MKQKRNHGRDRHGSPSQEQAAAAYPARFENIVEGREPMRGKA
jgi:hypothetical protein